MFIIVILIILIIIIIVTITMTLLMPGFDTGFRGFQTGLDKHLQRENVRGPGDFVS